VFTLPPLAPEYVAEFDPFSVPTFQSNTTADGQGVFVKMSTGNNLAEFKDDGYFPEAKQTELLRCEVAHTSNEANHFVDAFAVDPSYNGLSQLLVSSAESVDHENCDNVKELQPHPEHACSSRSPSTSDDGQHVSREGKESYVQVWNCFSCHPLQNEAKTGAFSDTAASQPLQREVIKSDDSCVFPALSPPVSPSFDGEVFCTAPVPKKRSVTHLSNSDQSVKAPLPSRLAPFPSCEANGLMKMTDKDISVEGSASSVLSVLPTTLEDDLRLVSSVLMGTNLPRLGSIEEERTHDVSFSPPVKPRESPRQVAVTGPSPGRDRLPPLIMPSTTLQPFTSSPLTSTASSPLDKVIAVGGVNILATRGSPKTSTSSEVLSPVTPSTRTPPVPPPKLRRTPEVKNEEQLFTRAVNGNSSDEDGDVGDVGFSKFL